MLNLRCTQKLLKRLPTTVVETPQPSTTLLGDWYANILFSKPQLILCVSERTLLPVVVQAKDIAAFPERLAVAVHELLTVLGVPSPLANQERAEMQEVQFGRTINKRLLGSINEFMFHLDDDLRTDPTPSLLQRSLRLGEMPCGPIGFKFPTEVALELFASGRAIAHGIH